MGQVLLSPHALPPGQPYYPASAQLYMNYTAYYPRYGWVQKASEGDRRCGTLGDLVRQTRSDTVGLS